MLPVNDQTVDQDSKWERIIQCRYDLAVVMKGLIWLKFSMLNLIVLDTFLMCFLNVSSESSITPRILKCGTSSSSTPSKRTWDLLNLADCLLNTSWTVFFVLSMMRHKSHNQTCTLDSALVSLDDMVSSPCVTIAASNAIQSNFT